MLMYDAIWCQMTSLHILVYDKYEKISHDIFSYTRICQNMKRYLCIYSYIRVYCISLYILVLCSGICSFMTVYHFETKYIPTYTMYTLYIQCMWIYITLHTCIYLHVWFVSSCTPPAGPPESCESAAANVLIQGTQVQAQWCLIFHASSFIPPGRCRLVLPLSGRLRLQPAAAAAGCRRGGCSRGRPAS